ncbi:TonB-dependent receptor [Halomonas sp. HP20-15]|uniref:TonB-dependent receptor domain-containing protein n=1 Tax=Halomonas sp. HP20-15 TaxID=3085901 RepID=UPI00298170A7|nr:TonB-dependent receptor [Halomonas sp. HP20-15]MDW5376876.1 TonB-dependent receptor [Halomonas sp. HP20-15]
MHYKKHPKKHPLWLAVGLATASSLINTAQAEQRLNTVQVTANRLPQSQADVMASTTVIERAEIERLQASSVVELLQGRAGIELTQNGAPGAQSSLFLRGSESDHTLILVDGVRINSATSGGASLEFLPPAAIERIEIVRGPRAAAYGADAIGGVIQIFTRDAQASGTQASLSARVGSDDTYRQNARLAIGDADTRLDATLFNRNGEGFNATRGDASGERDGFEREGAQLGFSQRLDAEARLSLTALRENVEADYDGCYRSGDFLAPVSADCVSTGYLQSFSGQLDVALASDWDMVVSAGHFDEQREERYAGERQSLTETHRDELGLQHRFSQANGVDVLGIDYRHESIDFANRAGAEYQRDSRENLGVYGLVQRQYGAHELSASLRYDDDSLFGDETTGSLGYAYQLTATQRLGTSYGSAFKAPNLSDLYGTFSPNPDLDAETSKNLEAYWAYDDLAWNARVTAFDNRIDDLIVYTGSFPDASYRNVDEARIRGIELTGGWQGERLSTQLAVTFQDPEVRRWSDEYAGIGRGDRLLSRAERFARLDVDYQLTDAWRVGSTLLAFSERTSYGGAEVGGYGRLDLRTAWQVTPMIELSAKLENALDKRYQLVDGYNTQDRYIEGGITLRL